MNRAAVPVAVALALVVSNIGAASVSRPIEPLPPEMFVLITPVPRVPPVIHDRHPGATAPTRHAPEAEPGAIVVQPEVRGQIAGLASWYCRPGRSVCPKGYAGGMYAAAGPGLRAAICGAQDCTAWRGMRVLVNGHAVTLVDWCQCYWKQPHEKLIDLFWDAWVRTGAKGGVRIRW